MVDRSTQRPIVVVDLDHLSSEQINHYRGQLRSTYGRVVERLVVAVDIDDIITKIIKSLCRGELKSPTTEQIIKYS